MVAEQFTRISSYRTIYPWQSETRETKRCNERMKRGVLSRLWEHSWGTPLQRFESPFDWESRASFERCWWSHCCVPFLWWRPEWIWAPACKTMLRTFLLSQLFPLCDANNLFFLFQYYPLCFDLKSQSCSVIFLWVFGWSPLCY